MQALLPLLAVYTLEPLFTRLYVQSMWAVGQLVVAEVRKEVFRSILVQRTEFFDSYKVHPLPRVSDAVVSYTIVHTRRRDLLAILRSPK